ncbi:MAG: hypothetical protein Q7U71_02845 [bacterium]|nr:hypothetical protein [bacterium]
MADKSNKEVAVIRSLFIVALLFVFHIANGMERNKIYTLIKTDSIAADEYKIATKVFDLLATDTNIHSFQDISTKENFIKAYSYFDSIGRSNDEKNKIYSPNQEYYVVIEGPHNLKVPKLAGMSGEVKISLFNSSKKQMVWVAPIYDAMRRAKVFVANDGKNVVLYGCTEFEYEVKEKIGIVILDEIGKVDKYYDVKSPWLPSIKQSRDGNLIAYINDTGESGYALNVLDIRNKKQRVIPISYCVYDTDIVGFGGGDYCGLMIPGFREGTKFVLIDLKNENVKLEMFVSSSNTKFSNNGDCIYFFTKNKITCLNIINNMFAELIIKSNIINYPYYIVVNKDWSDCMVLISRNKYAGIFKIIP